MHRSRSRLPRRLWQNLPLRRGGQRGWHEYVYREGEQIVAALCTFIVADGLANGARCFLADSEAPLPELETPAYAYFGRLGFTRSYVRTDWALP